MISEELELKHEAKFFDPLEKTDNSNEACWQLKKDPCPN